MTKHAGADASENIAQQVNMFGKLPQQCSACSEPFDKQDKEMVISWNVVVHQEVVRLFCPECIAKAKGVIENERE